MEKPTTETKDTLKGIDEEENQIWKIRKQKTPNGNRKKRERKIKK